MITAIFHFNTLENRQNKMDLHVYLFRRTIRIDIIVWGWLDLGIDHCHHLFDIALQLFVAFDDYLQAFLIHKIEVVVHIDLYLVWLNKRLRILLEHFDQNIRLLKILLRHVVLAVIFLGLIKLLRMEIKLKWLRLFEITKWLILVIILLDRWWWVVNFHSLRRSIQIFRAIFLHILDILWATIDIILAWVVIPKT